MARAPKRPRINGTVAPVVQLDAAALPNKSALPHYFIPFQTGPSLDHIPDDVLDEILSHLPTFTEAHISFQCQVIHPSFLARTPTLRALSRTSRLLRSRCLAMAWQSLELCAVDTDKPPHLRDEILGRATETAIRVLKASPYLLPSIQTVSIVLTRFRPTKIIPALAAFLARLPNLITIQVICTGYRIKTAIMRAFKRKMYPSVRKIFLDCTHNSAHEIIKCCPNVEEVTFTGAIGYKDTEIEALLAGNCRHVCILRGIPRTEFLPRLAELLPNLKYVSVQEGDDLAPLASFPLLDTIQIDLYRLSSGTILASEHSKSTEKAIEILEKNESRAEKTVLLTGWYRVSSRSVFSKKVLKVWPEM